MQEPATSTPHNLLPIGPAPPPAAGLIAASYQRRNIFQTVKKVIISVVKMAIPAGSPIADMAPLQDGQVHSISQHILVPCCIVVSRHALGEGENIPESGVAEYGLRYPARIVACSPRSSQIFNTYVASAKGVAPAGCSHCHGFHTTCVALPEMVLRDPPVGPTG